MKRINIFLTILVFIGGMTSCGNQLDVKNPNSQTTYDFGNTVSDLQEAVIAIYNRIRLDGTFSRVGYTLDAVRGDEVWNSSQQWYLEYDNLDASATDGIGDLWPWRDFYHVVNRANFVLSKVDNVSMSKDVYDQIKGQALFLRSLAYYYLGAYYQNVPLITSYSAYNNLTTMYASTTPQDTVFDQIEKDLTTAMEILPSRDEGGQWAEGRATCGSAAGYLARALMFQHKYAQADTLLKSIIAGKYGHYKLMPDYGDNFREGTKYENNAESLFEVQFLDYGTEGTVEEWTPVNISSVATQGQAIESNCAPQAFGSWGDLAASPWLYKLFKEERCTDGRLDPRLYWTMDTYEKEYNSDTGVPDAAYPKGDPRSNIMYQTSVTATPLSNASQGGIAIAKWTNARNNIYSTITTGLHCGVNVRLMRYSDVLLRAAECDNELYGPTQEAIDYINQVRERVALPDLQLSDFPTKDKLFEQIANVERPKEFGCENGRGIDLIRWGFFYNAGRLKQMEEHGLYELAPTDASGNIIANPDSVTDANATGNTFQYYKAGHEYFPIYQGTLDADPNLVGNSANKDIDNSTAFFKKYGADAVHPVTSLN